MCRINTQDALAHLQDEVKIFDCSSRAADWEEEGAGEGGGLNSSALCSSFTGQTDRGGDERWCWWGGMGGKGEESV